jgi:hypothetical protein
LTTRRTTSSRSCSPRWAPSRSRTRPAFDTPPRSPVWGPASAGRPLSGFLELKADVYRRRLLDLQRRVHTRDQPGRSAQTRPRAGLGRAGVGLGVAGEPPHPLQPRPPTPTASRGASARPTSGGTPTAASGPGTSRRTDSGPASARTTTPRS